MSFVGTPHRWPALALHLVALWLPLQYLPTRQYQLVPQWAVWFDDLLLAGLALWAGLVAVRHPSRARLPLNAPLAVFLVVAIASAIRNHASGVELLLGLRALLQGVAVYYIVVLLRVPRRDLVRIGLLTVGLAVLQAPFACYQLATTYQMMSRDEVVGTMWRGASNSLAYFMVLVMLPLTGFWLRHGSRRWPLVALAAMLIPFMFSSSRGAYYLAPVVWVAGFWPLLRRQWRARAVFAAQVLLAVALLGFYYSVKPTSPGSEVAAELSLSRVVREQRETKGGMGRLYYVGYLVHLFEREGPATFWIGVGPARFSSTSGAYLAAPLLAEATRGAHSPIIPSQIVATVAEFGALGFAAFAWAVWRGIRILQHAAADLTDPGWRGFAEGAVGAGLFFALAIPLENIWELPFCASYFWGAAGAVTRLSEAETS